MRCESGVLSYWHTSDPTSGASASAGNRLSKKRARTRHAVGARHTLVARWIEPRPRRVIRDLEAGAGRRGYSVHLRRVDVDPHRQRRIAEPRIAGGRAEVVDLLARRDDAIADDVGKELGQPRSAREDENVGLQCHAIPHRDLLQARVVRRDRRQGCRLPVDSALGAELLDHSFTGATREEIARLRLEENRRRIVETNLRIAAPGFRVGQRRKSARRDRRGHAPRPRQSPHRRRTSTARRSRAGARDPDRTLAIARGRAAPSSCRSARMPYVARMIRVSPPELARACPGAQASTRVTLAPNRRSDSAVHPPNAPAPKTTTRGLFPRTGTKGFKGMMTADSAGSRYNDSAMALCRI